MKQVKEGYKMTELGEIPQEWEVILLSEIGEFKNGLNKAKEDFGFGYKFVNIQNAYIGNEINVDKLDLMNASESELIIYSLKKGDIILVRSSVKPTGVGYPILFNSDLDNIVYCGFMIRYRYDIEKIIPKYMLYQLRSSKIRNNILDLSTISANTNINQESLKKIKIPVPPLPEQKKIASILSKVDEQIELTDNLIEKTKDLKKGLMQNLLSKGIGHTEFKETEIGKIPTGWEVKIFKEVCVISQGLQIAIEDRFKQKSPDRLPYITIQYLNNKNNYDNQFYIPIVNKNVICTKDDILMTRTGNTGFVVTNEHGIFHNNFFKVNYNKEILEKKYLFYYLKSNKIQKIIKQYAGTTTIPDLKHGDFYKIIVTIPPLEEQKKIASILSSVDIQIEEYQNKKSKLEELKKGLMQQLLTGKIRVKTN